LASMRGRRVWGKREHGQKKHGSDNGNVVASDMRGKESTAGVAVLSRRERKVRIKRRGR